MIINLAKIRFGGSGGGTSPAKPEDFFQETYTANGNYDVAPQAGHVFSGGTVTVNVQGSGDKPEETFDITPTNSDQSVTPTTGSVFSSGTVRGYDVDPIYGAIEDLNIGEVTPPAGGGPSIYDGTWDEEGLKAIGWDDEDISYFKSATPHFSNEDYKYVVSEENKALYGVVTQSNFDDYKNNPDMKFVPRFEITGTFNNAYNCPYIVGIPRWLTYSAGSLFTPGGFKEDSNLVTIPPMTMVGEKADYMFYNTKNLEVIPSIDLSSVTSTNLMFNGSGVKRLPHLSLDACTDITNMFSETTRLEGVDISIPNVTDVSNVFPSYNTSMKYITLRDCRKLTKFDAPSPARITDITITGASNFSSEIRFRNNAQQDNGFLEHITVTGIEDNSGSAGNLSNLCWLERDLKSITLHTADGITIPVTDAYAMFQDCQKLTDFDIQGFDFSKCPQWSSAFQGCQFASLPSVFDLSGATQIDYTFGYNNAITDINGLGINWSNITSALGIFNYCNGLTRLGDLDFNSVPVGYMFQGCSNLSSVGAITIGSHCNQMFDGCSQLSTVGKVTINIPEGYSSSAEYMFQYAALTTATVELKSQSSGTNISLSGMFANCDALHDIHLYGTGEFSGNPLESCYNIKEAVLDAPCNTGLSFANNTELTSLTLGNNTHFDGTAFRSNTKLESLTINAQAGAKSTKVTWFGTSSGSHNSLTDLTINGHLEKYTYIFEPLSALNYNSIKSILTAGSKSDTVSGKSIRFYKGLTVTDVEGELAGLVSACNAKGWSITGLTIN